MARIRRLADMQALIESRRPPPGSALSVPQRLAQMVRNSATARDIWSAAYAGNLERVRELLDADPSLVNRNGDDRLGDADRVGRRSRPR